MVPFFFVIALRVRSKVFGIVKWDRRSEPWIQQIENFVILMLLSCLKSAC